MSNIENHANRIFFLKQNSAFLSLILFCIGILLFRNQYSGKSTDLSLLWNLFLAIIPYGLAVLIYQNFRHNYNKFIYILFIFLWLLFYPNAPYIITDLIYLRQKSGVPIWFDILLFFSFAWTGLILGLASIRLIHITVENNFGKLYGWIFVISVIILGGFGIYIGRYLRWNSWDFIQNPQLLFSDLAARISSPHEHMNMCGITILFSLFFLLAYLSILYFLFPNKTIDEKIIQE